MMMMGLHFMQEVPFHTVYIHALVRDEKGAKMSKSKGNVIDPLELVDAYGADALRFTLAAMAAQGRDVKLARSRVEGYRNFATKLWNATRFADTNGADRAGHFYPDRVQLTLNRWIVGEAEKAAREVTEAIEAYRFNDAANAAYRFVWNVVCDWYIELSKPVLQPAEGTMPDAAAMAETRRTLGFVLDECVKLLHPFMPFVTEELWRVTAPPEGRSGLVAHAAWPRHHGLVDAAAEAEIGFVVDLVTAIRSARQEMGIAAGAALPVVLMNPSAETAERLARWDSMVRRLARVGELSTSVEPPRGAVQLVVRGEVVALPLAGVIDLAAEEKRLGKEIDKAAADIAKVDAKLGNPAFVEKAPEEVIEENRERREEAAERKAKFEAALALVRSAA
jgi:valyl-tRNA synthetase